MRYVAWCWILQKRTQVNQKIILINIISRLSKACCIGDNNQDYIIFLKFRALNNWIYLKTEAFFPIILNNIMYETILQTKYAEEIELSYRYVLWNTQIVNKNKTHILTEFKFMQLAKMTKSGAKYLTKEKNLYDYTFYIIYMWQRS